MIEATLAEAERSLASLHAGQRAWFWFCPDVQQVTVPLLLTTLADDPSMTVLFTLRGALPDVELEHYGLLSVAEDGRLTYGSETADRAMLDALAGWTRDGVAAHPGLSANAGARVVAFEEGRYVSAVYEDPSLWEDLERPIVGGSLAATRHALNTLAPGSAARFWASRAGPGGGAFLALFSEDQAAVAVRRLVLRSPGAPRAIQGELTREEDGTLCFRTASEAERLSRILLAVSRLDGLSKLVGKGVRIEGDTVWTGGPSGWQPAGGDR